MNHQGRSWRWGVRPTIVALAGVIVGYLTNIVSGGNPPVAAIIGFVFAVMTFLVLVWWDAVHAAAPPTTTPLAAPAIMLDQQIHTVRDGRVTALEIDGPINGDYDLHQRVNLAECSDITGIGHAPPNSSQGQS
jgi:hypothetical protein